MKLTLKQFKRLKGMRDNSFDRISCLPDELLSAIFSSLPTKDAVAASVVSRRMRCVLAWITSIDLDDFPISHCELRPHLIRRFAIFKNLVNSVLQGCESDHLTKFRLVIGGDRTVKCKGRPSHECGKWCLPDLEPALLNAWISFPLARIGLRELDLCICVRKPDGKLPPAVFACETLEILKLHMNLDVVPDSPFCLPNVKVLHLASFSIPDAFISRLVSSCPVLEDLAVDRCWWKYADFITISSPTLHSLFLNIRRLADDSSETDDYSESDEEEIVDAVRLVSVVTIDTPRLRYLRYYDDLAHEYRVTQMNDLVKAEINITYDMLGREAYGEATFQSMLSLLRPVCNVQHLSLSGACLEIIEEGDLKDQMPVFHNLKYLVLRYNYRKGGCDWYNVLQGILTYTPRLETLELPLGFTRHPESAWEEQRWGRECWKRAQAIPSCYRLHLKKLVTHRYMAVERELELVKFVLSNALVLEELVVHHRKQRFGKLDIVDEDSAEKTLKELPKASVTCSIQVLFFPS